MKANQKLHQANLDRWALLIQAQVDSGLTITAWCKQNNVSRYAYNYWKHQLKEEYVDSCIPDIVKVSPDSSDSAAVETATETQLPAESHDSHEVRNSRDSHNSHNSRHSYDPQPLHICTPEVDVSFSSSVSDDLILRIIKEVRYA